MQLDLDPPWLVADFGAPLRVLGWTINRPGFASARRVVWREVRAADLRPGLDPAAWIAGELAGRGLGDAPALLTSRPLRHHVLRRAEVGGAVVDCLATVGLSNGERVGTRRQAGQGLWGTINLAARISTPLSEGTLVEALSIAVEARTAAVMEAAPRALGAAAKPVASPRDGPRDGPVTAPITGTGTDCAVVAAPPGAGAYAGLHTPLGEALGRAVYAAVRQGADDWWAEIGRLDGWRPQPRRAAPPEAAG